MCRPPLAAHHPPRAGALGVEADRVAEQRRLALRLQRQGDEAVPLLPERAPPPERSVREDGDPVRWSFAQPLRVKVGHHRSHAAGEGGG